MKITVASCWIFWLCSVVMCEISTDVSCKDDVCTALADTGFAARHYIDAVVLQNEEKPEICRTDVCYEEATYYRDKGTVSWPETRLGQRVYHICPYSLNGAEYAWRECLYDSGGRTVWDGSGNETDCPGPPLTQLLDDLDQSMVLQENQTSNFTELWDVLSRLNDIISTYRHTPISDVDIHRTIVYVLDIYDIHTATGTSIPAAYVNCILNILNAFMEDDLLGYFDHVLGQVQYPLRILKMFQDLPTRISLGMQVGYRYEASNIQASVTIVESQNVDGLLSWEKLPGFRILLTQNDSYVQSPKADIWIRNPQSTGEDTTVGVIFLKYAYLMGPSATFYRVSGIGLQPCDSPITTSTTTTTTTTLAPIPENHTGIILSPLFEGDSDSESFCMYPLYEKSFNHAPLGSLVSVTVKKKTESGDFIDLNHDVSVEINTVPCPSSYYGFSQCHNVEGTECSNLKDDSLRNWTSFICSTIFAGDEIKCSCPGTGLFTLFKSFFPSQVSPPPALTEVVPQRTELSSFVGFNYNPALEIVGHVLSGISLCCLLITVLSHASFRNTRLKKPSQILIHLCVSLILLTIVLYVSSFLATTITRCAIANAVRYYLVFVSLFWNVTEAVNLYLMLVKVFNIEFRKFILKAALLAWGLPVVIVVITLSINGKTFHGHYIPEDPDTSERPAKCLYRCQLRSSTQYFAYLLPMAAIVLFNTVIYARVLREIFAARNQPAGQERHRHKLVKVIGAIATLVLLGIPWIFSAFAIIDPSGDIILTTTETIFQAIFVVFVNLQGVFLFLFHCVRSVKVRESWISVFSGTSSTAMGSSGREENTSGLKKTVGVTSSSSDAAKM